MIIPAHVIMTYWILQFCHDVTFKVGRKTQTLIFWSYSTRRSHPDHQYPTVRSFHSSVYTSNILAIVLPLMLLRSGMNSLMMCTGQHQLPPSGKKLKTYLSAKT